MGNTAEIAQERITLREWEHIQRCIYAFALTAPFLEAKSWRCAIETCIAQATQGNARIWWEIPAPNQAQSDRLIDIHYLQTYYGRLELAPGYLQGFTALSSLAHLSIDSTLAQYFSRK